MRPMPRIRVDPNHKPSFWLRHKRRSYGKTPRPRPNYEERRALILLAERITMRRRALEILDIGPEMQVWLFQAARHLVNVAGDFNDDRDWWY